MKLKLFFGLLLLASTSFLSCSSDDSSSDSNAQFEDKWWYSPDNTTLDVFFNSDGTYESTFLFNGMSMDSDGEWEWVNESTKTFRVFNLQGNATSEYYGKVSELDGDSMSLKMSLDEGETYSEGIPYVDSND